MSRWLGLRARLRSLLQRSAVDERMKEEMQMHLELETDRLVTAGVEPAEARRQARIAFGLAESYKEEMRAQRRMPYVEAFYHDVRFAMRSLARDRTFALVAVGTLALGIGAATVTYSVVSGIVLRDLPVTQAENIVVLWQAPSIGADEHLPVSYADLQAYRESTRAFSALSGVAFQGAVDVVMLSGAEAMPLAVTWVTGEFFPLLGIAPARGRLLQPADDAPGSEPVAVISHSTWVDRFASDAAILDRTLQLDGRLHRIVGVLPRGFAFPRNVDAWLPVLPSYPATLEASADPSQVMVFDVVGRVADGTPVPAAGAEFDAFLRNRDTERPAAMRGMRGVLTTLPERIHGEIRTALWAASAAVIVLLLIACLNVANLLLIRSSIRTQELAIRTALGAGRARIVRQLLTESLVLATCGGALGAVIALLCVRMIVALAPPTLPQREMIALDGGVLIGTLIITLSAALLAGLIPALISARGDLSLWLRGGRASPTGAALRLLRPALVVGQVALALGVVICAGLFVRSLRSMQQLDMGFDASQLMVIEAMLPAGTIAERERLLLLQEEAISRIAALRGVSAATAMPKPPFSAQGGWMAPFSGESQTDEQYAANPVVNLEVVGPAYFETLAIPVLRGRAFTDADREGSELVAIVSRSIAQRAWPGENPIGKRIKLGPPAGRGAWHTVVGETGETRYRELLTSQPSFYLTTRQFAGPVPLSFAVRTDTEAVVPITSIRSALAEAHPELRVVSSGSMSERLAEPLAGPRFTTALFTTFAIITLLLAVVGVYGALSASVRDRQRELGIRMALGATAAQVKAIVLRQCARIALIGCALGVALAWAASRLLRSLIIGVSTTDATTYAVVTGFMLVAALLAGYVPARRAGRVDPVAVMRGE